MKRLFATVCLAATAFGMSSCGSSKSLVSADALNGEWNVIEINGKAVTPAAGQEYPFIGFKTAESQLYGTTGCNRFFGGYKLGAKGAIDLGNLGSTRMMCPDMKIEDSLFDALGKVKQVKQLDDQVIGLCADGKKALVVLKKK